MPQQPTQRAFELGGYWLSQRPNSSQWCRTWFDAEARQTRRASLATNDLETAKLALSEWVTANRRMNNERPEETPLATVFERYFREHAAHLRSQDQARHALLRFAEFFPEALVTDLNPNAVRRFIGHLQDTGRSIGYIRRVLAVGKAALNLAVREGWITATPHIQLPPESEPRERVLTMDEAAALISAATQPHMLAYLQLAFGTGARPEAILQLCAEQVDLNNRLMRLNPVGRAQNKKRRPALPIAESLASALADMSAGPLVAYAGAPIKSIRPAFKKMKARAAQILRRQAAMLARTARNAGNRHSAWRAILDGKTQAAALLNEVTPYTIRHTVATELRKRSVPVWEVAAWMGHATGYRTTERYAKYGPDHLTVAVAAINAYLIELDRLAAGRLFPKTQKPAQRASCVLPGLKKVVELRGIEPLTSTMPL
jgi:integrase